MADLEIKDLAGSVGIDERFHSNVPDNRAGVVDYDRLAYAGAFEPG